MLVTDPGVAALGHPDRIKGLIEAEGIEVVIYDRARVETFVTSFPDCQLRVGMTATSFELPLNGTRVIDTPAGSDVCWRRIEPPFTQATAPGVPLMTPWNRAFTASGRIVDTRL